MDDRRVDTLKEALHYTAGITFQAAEGGEEDIRLRGFSLTASGDIFIDGVRDPAFYERDIFNFDRDRGAARLGLDAVRPRLDRRRRQPGQQAAPACDNVNEVATTIGSGSYLRLTGDFNLKTGETSALRINAMTNTADNYGNYDRQARHRAELPLGHRHAPTSSRSATSTSTTTTASTTACRGCAQNDSARHQRRRIRRADPGRPEELLRRRERLQRRLRVVRHASATRTASQDGGELAHGAAQRRLRPRPARLDDPLLRPLDQCARRRHQSRVHRGRADPGDDQRRDAADPRHQQQGAGPDARPTCRPTTANTFNWFGRKNEVLAGIDVVARGVQQLQHGRCRPASSLDKNDAAHDDRHAERRHRRSTKRCARSAADAQLRRQGARRLRAGPGRGGRHWKVLAGLRWDQLRGRLPASSRRRPAAGTVTADRARAPTRSGASASACCASRPTKQSYYVVVRHLVQHLGRTLQLRRAGLEHAAGEEPQHRARRQARPVRRAACEPAVAMFHSTKYNERNRDSPDGHADRGLRAVGQAPRRRLRARPRRPHHAGVGGVRARTPGFRAPRSTRPARGGTPDRRAGRPAAVDDAAPQRHDLDHLPGHAGSCASAAGLNARSSQTPQPQSARHRRAELRHRRPDGRVHLRADRSRSSSTSSTSPTSCTPIRSTPATTSRAQPRTVYATLTARF